MTVLPESGSSSAAARPTTAEPTIGSLVKDASESVSTIVRGEIELAKHELKSSVKNAGVGLGMFAAAGVLLFFSMTFGLLALAEGLISLGLWRWLGYLVVFGGLLLIVVVLALIGVRKVKRVKAPQQTISTGRETVAYLRTHPNAANADPGNGARRPVAEVPHVGGSVSVRARPSATPVPRAEPTKT